MKLWHLALLAGVGAGVWWWWRRSGGFNPLAILDPPTGNAPGYYTAPAPLMPAAPGTAGGGWLDTAAAYGNRLIDAQGAASESVFRSMCGGGKVCDTLAPGAKLAGKATAAITVKSVEYGVKGLKAIIPGW